MVNVAIAGSSGLAQFIANYLSTKTCHQFIILSRFPNPGLVSRGWQVLEVDYYNNSKLRYMLTGVDVVISTISGPAEASLITAAAQVNVRRFIPSEFEGPPSKRTISKLPDRGNCQSLSLLQQYEMEYTIFTCGVFYERLAPGGMAAFQLGKGTYIDKEGEYLINIPSMETEVPHLSDGQDSMICMTSAQDVARAVVAALDLPRWPREFRMFGDRMSLTGLVGTVESVFGCEFKTSFISVESLCYLLSQAEASGDVRKQRRVCHLLDTVNGCYDFDLSNVDSLNIRPQRFQEWLRMVWA
ncbi:hypothetical protein D8B26_002684 [Coccidioides posadasii str. Silveira]|uniref:NmrA-like family protein n=1 Tax=Coccidioides posadasii (strain C735) TaxID=222929 RepID=C5P6K3_COCP7|nr:NmrA-like family protein [Coccidioides posadasii C735 delta SOWgp]EER27053.1 NmrA-like family protein [Coccidioides posadasii C735 delta SOWgp]QVM07989.1 hypothetical protein D8B26_002684 [Coccidioides posadasii str. Silveira]|eukprot:XP_003069198.1 NmrA-like family protein [Coccidioides posadasii C735 delta SOWgp]